MIGSAYDIARWMREHDDIMVCTHFRPDGDAYGTALALCEAARALGKRCFPACDDPVEQKYRFMPFSDEFVNANALPFAPSSALGADISDIARLGELARVFEACPSRAVLDHHATNAGFAQVNYIDETAASAGELALEVVDALGLALTRDMARNLFVAVSTDCGNFSFQNTSARAFRAAARCVEADLDVEEVTRKLYRTRALAKTRLLGLALANIGLYGEGVVAAVALPLSMFTEAEAVSADAHGIVNYLNEIEGVRIGFICEEQPGGVKFSFRAAGGANVAELAREFGGGGHIAASGANVNGARLADIFPVAVEAAVRHARK